MLVRAPQGRLLQLGRLDERISAHLDGIAVAAGYGTALCQQALDPPGIGTAFAATVRSIELRDADWLHKLLDIAHAMPQVEPGVISAFGWVPAAGLRGIARPLLASPDAWRRRVGLAAYGMHSVDPGATTLLDAIDARSEPGLRARALRMAGILGRVELRDACAAVARSGDTDATSLEASRAALLLGDRDSSFAALRRLVSAPNKRRDEALGLLLKVSMPDESLRLLGALHEDPGAIRTLVRAIGIAGTPHLLPWLIGLMEDLKLSRIAGESFSLITGLDLAYLDLDRKPPENVEIGPNDEPADADVAIDEDDGLPWPDPQKIAAWWKTDGVRFATGTCYFMGAPPTPAHCLSVLQTGFQRQRRHAAEYLCLLQPGMPLFNIAAPAWRQKRLLAQMAGS